MNPARLLLLLAAAASLCASCSAEDVDDDDVVADDDDTLDDDDDTLDDDDSAPDDDDDDSVEDDDDSWIDVDYGDDAGSPFCSVWAEGTEEGDSGATRDFYNRGVSLPWTHELGDWTDADGTLQGDVAFSIASVADDGSTGFQEWDVTGLAQEFIDGTHPAQGFVLRLLAGGGPFDFTSREGPIEAERPELVVTTADGAFTLPPEADVKLEASTYQGFGDAADLRVATTSNVLLRFDLSTFPPETVLQGATLRLFKFADYGGGSVDIGVFRSSHGLQLPPAAPLFGLSENYPGDVGIAEHPDVLLFSDFESGDWGDDWSTGADDPTLDLVTSDPTNLFEPLQGDALRSTVPGGENTGMTLRYRFMEELGAEPEEIWFRYYLRFGDDWSPTEGGKLPGIAGTYDVAGWGGRPSDGTNGWSARGTFSVPAPDTNPYGGHSTVGSYVYHADMAGQYGDVTLWTDGCRGVLDKNRWYSVETHVQMNTPGQNDGVLRSWINGRPSHERTDWRWRDIDALKIETIWMNVYHGGTGTPPADLHLYIDNVVIATSYIGPMASGEQR